MWPFSGSKPPAGEDGSSTMPSPLPLSPPSDVEPQRILDESPSPSPQPQTTTLIYESPASLARRTDLSITGHPNERLSMPPAVRWPVMLTVTSIVGFSLGATRGGRIAADRYRAMNAHRLPATQAGWYLYHRSKSYHTTVGAVKEGVRFAGVLSIWATVFMLAEEGLDQARGRVLGWRGRGDEEMGEGEVMRRVGRQRDLANTTMAALMTAGLYSRWQRMDVFATTKMAGMAFRAGVGYGVAQDLVSCVRGEPPGYVAWLSRRVFGEEKS